MDVQEFFELSAGKWFSQKTSHHLTLKQSEQGKSDLAIEILPKDDPQMLQLCQQAGIDSSSTWGGAKYTWKGTTHWDTQQQSQANQQGSSIVVAIPDKPFANSGRLFQATSIANISPVIAQYTLGDDDALTLTIDNNGTHSEERIWFESPNVRVRTTIVTRANGDNIATFYSEIRRMGEG
jgi:CpeS-like protein